MLTSTKVIVAFSILLIGMYWMMREHVQEPPFCNVNQFARVRQSPHKAVFLVSQCRSGSSIIGELFRQQQGSLYLYEPLYPFREFNSIPAPESQVPGTVAAVEAMARCRLDKLHALYERALKETKQPDLYQ